MTEITNEHRAAWQEVKDQASDIADWIAPLLPSELTNPQPALPTKPNRAWADKQGDVWVTDRHGDLNCVLDGELDDPRPYAPFTPLVPERTQITREQVGLAVVIANGHGGEMGSRVWIDRLHAALAKLVHRD